jgi:uncharacterized repeat protein (TIGR03843 family)
VTAPAPGTPGAGGPAGPTARIATPQRLAAAPLTVLGAYAHASNTTLLVHLDDRRPAPEGGDPDAVARLPNEDLAVYKPVRGQRPLWDFDADTLPHREVATAVVDRLLGFDLVPPTCWRDEGPFGPGSLQAHVPHDPDQHLLTWLADPDRRDDRVLARLVVLDLVVNNTDRKAGHVLVGPDRAWAIDHGVTFHVDDKLRTVAWDLQGRAVPSDVRRAVAGLAATLRADAAVLAAHLSAAEVAATVRRCDRVAAMEAFPALAHRGQLPWPLV